MQTLAVYLVKIYFWRLFMKRYITIKGDIIFKEYNSESWELIIVIYPEDVVPFYMELQLRASELSESFTVSSLNSSLGAIITFKGDGEESRIKLVNKKYKLELNNNDFGVVSMFLLKYYQDSYAPVSHIHIGLAKDDSIKGNGELTILASASAEPISGKEAKRILGID